MNGSARTLVRSVQCDNPECRKVIMRIWMYQGRRQCENVSCPCDNAHEEALKKLYVGRRVR
ncbi:hypothetical protein JOD27_004219 [Lentzea nigeriaca]|nr:hypothetical protein [Lentzea nigeriaca]